jgi:hypothetical protein
MFTDSIVEKEENYVELKGVPEMKGSINAVISGQKKMYRPPSLSESFAWSAENVLRATNSATSLDLLVSPSTQVSPQKPPPPQIVPVSRSVCNEARIVNYSLRFLFHITLISIFESVFFFLYISKLEDNGINHTVGSFITDAVDSCNNLTAMERNITNDFLDLFVNGSQIIAAGNSAEAARSSQNRILFNRSWIYVGGLGGLFVLLLVAAKLRKIHIKWGKLILENIGLVALLAAYEYTFFSTVIFPYGPITASEIARNAVFEFQETCGLLTT